MNSNIEKDKENENEEKETKETKENREENNKLTNSDDDGNGNLSDNKISTEIEPKTYGNNVNVSLCSCTLIFSCTIS